MYKLSIFLTVLLSLTIISCKQGVKDPSDSKPTDQTALVYASNFPLYYFAEKMGGGFIKLEFPAAESTDPAYWQPDPESISAMQQADLVLLNGASYEKWLGKVSLPSSKLVNTTEGMENRFIPLEETVTHIHGPGGEHEHAGTAMTTWMDFSLALEQARSVKEALEEKFPEKKSEIVTAYTVLEGELSKLDQELQSITYANPDLHVIFSHPVYQYFEKRYNVQGTSLHWEPDVLPDEEQWKELSHIIEHHPGSIMVWEGEPSPEIASRLESTGVRFIVFNPCGNRPDEGDFLSVMKSNLESLRTIY